MRARRWAVRSNYHGGVAGRRCQHRPGRGADRASQRAAGRGVSADRDRGRSAVSGPTPRPRRTWGSQHLLVYDHVLGADPEAYAPWAGPYTSNTMFHEILVLFGYLAAVAPKLELVTSVVILPQRQTALVAKQAAEVDVLTGGKLPARRRDRLELGRVRRARDELQEPRPALRGADRADAEAVAGAGHHPRGPLRQGQLRPASIRCRSSARSRSGSGDPPSRP